MGDAAPNEVQLSDQDTELRPPKSLFPLPMDMNGTSEIDNESSYPSLKEVECRKDPQISKLYPSEQVAQIGGSKSPHISQQSGHRNPANSKTLNLPIDRGLDHLPSISRHDPGTSHELALNIHTQDSPTQFNSGIETSLMNCYNEDDNLPDTQANFEKIDRISTEEFDSPTQMNPIRLLKHTNTTTQDDSLLDTLIHPGHINISQTPESESPTQEATITNHFSFTKHITLGSETSAIKAASRGSPNQPDEVSQEAEATLPFTQRGEISSLATQNTHGILATTEDALPDTQAALPLAVVADHQISLPSSVEGDILGLGSGFAPVMNDDFGLPSNINMEDEDLPDTQPGILDTGIGPSSMDLGMRHEDSQPTQLDSSRISRNSIGALPSLKEMQAKLSAKKLQQVLGEAPGVPSASFTSEVSASSASAAGPKAPLNKLTCRERKRIATSHNRPPSLTRTMKQWITKTHNLLDPFREDDECWFHPAAPPARLTKSGILQPCGKLQKRFTWQDHRGKHSIVLNYGIVSKIINFKLTKQQTDGFINKQWHLSHLCGNWTCLNPAHTTVEPGKTNISRNNCFSHRSGCLHVPKCMKEKKVPLDPDGKPVNHNPEFRGEATQKAVDNWGDWSMQSFDDGEVSVLIDDQDEEEFALEGEDEDEGENVLMELETVEEIEAQH